MFKIIIIYIFLLNSVFCKHRNSLTEVFSWKQIGYDFDGIQYTKDSNYEKRPDMIVFEDETEEKDKYFIQYNNVPIGFEVYKDIVFVTVPRRRYGIPATLNYVERFSSRPLLKPYPNSRENRDLVSIYRPRVDACDRLWAVDTGLLEIPDARRQIQPPSIVIFDLKTSKRILKYELNDNDLVNNRTSGGLTSITVDVTPNACDKAFAYINDLATGTMVVFSLETLTSWSVDHPAFKYDPVSLNFTVAGFTIPWMDNLFSIALTSPGKQRKAFFHPMVSTYEFSIDTEALKNGDRSLAVQTIGNRGNNTQSGSHGYHAGTNTLIFANIAQDAILCWNINKELTPNNVAMIAQDRDRLVYMSDLKIVEDEVWVLANKMPIFVYSNLDRNKKNFYILKGSIKSLIKGTVCDET